MNVLYEVLVFWLIITLVIFFLIRGIIIGNRQKRNEEMAAIKKRLEEIENRMGLEKEDI